MKKIVSILLAVTIVLSMTSCQLIQSVKKPGWDELVDELFVSSMESDTLTMHFYVQDPESFGMDDYEETLGSLEYTEDDTWASDALELIEEYDYEDLTEEQQYEYDVLHWYLETESMGEGYDYYQELAEPTYGIQANYPINMADYAFNEKEDIENYMELLDDTPRYFDELLAYEQTRSEKGLFMTDFQLDQMLEDCESFIGDTLADNVLITSFDERLEGLSDVTKEEAEEYRERNQEKVEAQVIPAYRTFMEGMEALRGTCKGSGAIADYPDGKGYYEYLARNASSSERSVEELQELLEKYINRQMMELYTILNENYDLLEQIETPAYGATDPVDILEMISERMDVLVPSIGDAKYTVKYVPESLQGSLSPAFCYVPQIDNVQSVIYINQSPEYDNMDFFTTVAHEGYPGHMYQNTYFYGTDPSPFRHILSFLGYTEGWACYISYKALALSDIEDEDLITLLTINEALGYEISALADIGVNYEGWTPKELQEFLNTYGYEITDEDLEENYGFFLNNPAGYLSYSASCCEYWELESYAKQKLKSRFDEVEFHRVILDAGPTSFSILSERLDDYITEVQ